MSDFFIHSHVSTNIVDNTTVVATTATPEKANTRVLCIFTSDKGDSNKLVSLQGSSNLAIEKFGNPNVSKHKFNYLVGLAALDAGAKVDFLRVVPEADPDHPEILPASYANMFLDIQTKSEVAVASSDVAIANIGTAAGTVAITASTIDGESTVTLNINPAFATTVEVGDTVYFSESVMGDVSEASNASIARYFYVEGNNLNSGLLSNGSEVIVRYSNGQSSTALFTATVSDQNASLSRYGFIIQSTSDVVGSQPTGTDESVTLLTSTGIEVGEVTIRRIGKLTAPSDYPVVTLTPTFDVATTGLVGSFVIKYNGLSYLVSMTAVEAITTVALLRTKINTVMGFAMATVSGATVVLTGATKTAGSSLEVTNITITSAGDSMVTTAKDQVYGLDITNIKTSSVIVFDSKLFTIFNKKSLSKDEVWLEDTYNELDDMTGMTNKACLVKVASIVTPSVAPTTTTFNIKSFTRNPASAVSLKRYNSGHVQRTLVRPVVVSVAKDELADFDDFIESPYANESIFTQNTSDGYKRHILMGLAKDTSSLSNDVGFIISANNSIKSENKRFFNVQFVAKTDGVVNSLTEVITGSFDNTALVGSQALWLNTTLNKYGTSGVKYFFNTNEYDQLLEDLDANLPVGADVHPGYFDFITGSERLEASLPEQEYVKISQDEIPVETYGGTSFAPKFMEKLLTSKSQSVVDDSIVDTINAVGYMGLGSSGSIDGYDADGNLLTKQEYSDMIDVLLVNAYKGLIIQDIYNSDSKPYDDICDVMNSVVVKNAIMDFINVRKDIFLWTDTNYGRKFENDINFKVVNLPEIDNYRVGLYGQGVNGKVNSYTQTELKVSLVYEVFKNVIKNDKIHGIHVPVAGPNYGVLDIKEEQLTYNPSDEQQTELVRNKINFAVSDELGTYTNSQITAKEIESQLSNIPVIRGVLRLIKDSKIVVKRYKFEYSESITSLQQELNDIAKTYVGKSFGSVAVTASQTELQKIAKKVGIKLSVTSRDFLETFDITLELNRS